LIGVILSYFILGIGAYYVFFNEGNVYGIIIMIFGIFGVIGDFVRRRKKNDVN